MSDAERIADLEREVARLRKIIAPATLSELWSSAEIQDGSILLWHESGALVVAIKPTMWAPFLESAHRELVMADLLDVFRVRSLAKEPGHE